MLSGVACRRPLLKVEPPAFCLKPSLQQEVRIELQLADLDLSSCSNVVFCYGDEIHRLKYLKYCRAADSTFTAVSQLPSSNPLSAVDFSGVYVGENLSEDVGNVCRDSVEHFFAHIRKFTVLLRIERDAPTRPQYDRQSSLALSTDRPGSRNSSASRQILCSHSPPVKGSAGLPAMLSTRPASCSDFTSLATSSLSAESAWTLSPSELLLFVARGTSISLCLHFYYSNLHLHPSSRWGWWHYVIGLSVSLCM